MEIKPIVQIAESLEMEEKSAPSDRLYNGLSLACSIAAVALFLTSIVTYFVNRDAGLAVFLRIFYPMLILMIAGLALGLTELLRNRYFTSVLSVQLSAIAFLATIAFVIAQGVLYGRVFILPFNYL